MAKAKNSNHWFRCVVSDEERMFRGVGVQAEGLFAKLRRIAFDCDPVGFLVDHTRHAHEQEYLADCVHLPNGTFRTTLRELRDRQIVQTVDEFRAGLSEALHRNKRPDRRVAAMLEVFDPLVASLASASGEVLLIPTLVTEYLSTVVGRKTGADNKPKEKRIEGEANVLPFAAPEGPVEGASAVPPTGGGGGAPPPPPPTGEGGGGAPTLRYQSQNQSQNQNQRKEKRETTAASAREEFELRQQPGKAPWTWEKHLFLCDQVRKLDAELKGKHPEALDDDQLYASHFFGRFQFEVAVFHAAREFYRYGPASRPVPQPCMDGHHTPDPVTGRCQYCGGEVESEAHA